MNNTIKVAAMSDIHGYLPNDVPECDVLCIAGDILPLDIQNDMIRSISWLLLDFKPWAESLPCKKVLFVAGNHDFVFQWLGPDKGNSGSEVMIYFFQPSAYFKCRPNASYSRWALRCSIIR